VIVAGSLICLEHHPGRVRMLGELALSDQICKKDSLECLQPPSTPKNVVQQTHVETSSNPNPPLSF
jgi:hypothetical protein